MSDERAGAPAGTEPPPPGAHEPAGRRVRRRPSPLRVVGTALLGGLGALLIAAAFIRVPYVIISPGHATALDDRIVRVTGAQTYRHGGDLLYLTVRVTDTDPNLYRWVFAELDGDASIVKKEDVIGCASYTASARLNNFLMQESQDVAKTVALRRLGYQVTEGDSRVLVVDVLCNGPSRGQLEPGDLILAIDGKPVTAAQDVRPLVRARRPGDRVRVTVERGGRRVDVGVRLGKRGGAAFMGIATQDLTHSDFPVDVHIDTRRVSGPSAGLAFTLAIIDDLTPGDLTGGRRVAVTGSINLHGSVGTVGGVKQKAITARDNGASMILVPAGEVRDARDAVGGDLRVVSVRTLQDALRALRRAGGDPVPRVPAAPAQ